MSLRYKMFLGAGLTMILVLGLLTVKLSVETLFRAETEKRRVASLIFNLVQAWIGEQKLLGTGTADWGEVTRKLSRSDLFKDWIIVDPSRRTLVQSPTIKDIDAARADPNLGRAFDTQEMFVVGNVAYIPLLVSESDWVVLRTDLRDLTVPESYIVDSIRSVVGIMSLGTLLLLLILYILINSLVVRPLAALSEATARIAAGDYTHEIPHSGRTDELAGLVDNFNSMLRAIREYHGTLHARIDEATEKIRETQRRLVVAQRLSATGTLAAGIAHEVNNPLGGMINAARSLQRPGLDDGRRQVYLELVIDGLSRIEETVKKILQFSPRSPNPRPTEPRPVVDRAVALVEHRIEKRHIRLENTVDPALPQIFAEPQELQQVFVNLLINAVDAIGDHAGSIRIFSECRPGEVTIGIADTGCGMTEQEVEKAFDLFYTTKPAGEGTGLGLAVVQNIIQSHGGVVEIQSRKGSGTTVRISLPPMKPAVEPPAAPVAPNPGGPASVTRVPPPAP